MSSTAETMGRVTTRSRRVPSKAWYWLAAVVVLLGIGCGVTWGVVSTVRTHDRAQSLPRMDAPGRLQVPVEAGTSRLIFFEGEGKPSPEAMGITVTAPDGSSVPVKPYDLLMQYEIAGWVGAPIASFSAPTAGMYTISAKKAYHQGRISVGDNFVRTQAIDIVGALALIAACNVAGLVIVIVVAVKRSPRDRATGVS
jgi:hypothetical protein